MAAPGLSDPRFFQAELKTLGAAFSDLLSQYSHIPLDQQVQHIVRVRDEAYAVRPYPCLGRFRFVDLNLSTHPLYQDYILPTLLGKNEEYQEGNSPTRPQQHGPDEISDNDKISLSHGPIFLDLSSCLSQDTRKLAHDGVHPSRLYASDIEPAFIQLGYNLFRDEHVMTRSHFLVPGDVLASSSSATDSPSSSLSSTQEDRLTLLDGKVDILNATAIFHLFDLEEQKKIADRCLRLLRQHHSLSSTSAESVTGTTETSPSRRSNADDGGEIENRNPKRSLIVGGQAGNITSGSTTRRNKHTVFRHNLQSWQHMWNDIVSSSSFWKQKIKKIDVHGSLTFSEHTRSTERENGGNPSSQSVGSSGTNDGQQRDRYALGPPGEGDGQTTWNSMVVGRYEDGARWHTFWVWVEFL